MSMNEVSIEVTATDSSAPGLDSATDRVDSLGDAAQRTGAKFDDLGGRVRGTGDQAGESAGKLDRLGEAGGNAESQFLGLGAGISGVSTLMQGGTLSSEEMAMAFADLGDSVEHTVVPWVQKAGTGVANLGSKIKDGIRNAGGFSGSLRSLGRAAAFAAGPAALLAAGAALEQWNQAQQRANVDRLTNEFLAAGEAAQAMSEVMLSAARHGPAEFVGLFAELAATNREAAERFVDLAEAGGTADDIITQMRDHLQTLAGAEVQTAEDARDAADGIGSLEEATRRAEEAQRSFTDSLRAATDPVFAMLDAEHGRADAQARIGEAQQALNETIATYGENSTEATQAQRDLETAQIDAARAAGDQEVAASDLNAAIAENPHLLDEAIARLQGWVAQGAITQEQAAAMEGQFRGTAEQADRVGGTRRVTFTQAGIPVLRQMVHDLGVEIAQVEGVHHVTLQGTLAGTIRPRGAQRHGGIAGAQSGGVHDGLTMVNEGGFELLDLPPGTQVHSNPDSERILAGMGGGVTVNVNLYVQGSIRSDRDLVGLIRDEFENGGLRELVAAR